MTDVQQHKLDERYDDLRRQVLDHPPLSVPGRGLAIILNRGLTHWMEAWTSLPPPKNITEQSQTTRKDEIPRDHERKLVRIMAAMVLGNSRAHENPCEGAAHAF